MVRAKDARSDNDGCWPASPGVRSTSRRIVTRKAPVLRKSVLVVKDSITWHRLSPLRASVRLRDPSEAKVSLSPNLGGMLGGLSGFSAPALRTLV